MNRVVAYLQDGQHMGFVEEPYAYEIMQAAVKAGHKVELEDGVFNVVISK